MGVAAVLGGVAAAATTASAVDSIVNSGGGGGSGATGTYGGQPGTYIPTDQAQADQYYQQLFSQQTPFALSVPTSLYPQYQNLTGQITGNPYAALAQTGANVSQAATPGVAAQQLGGGNALYGAATGGLPYGNQLLANAFNPQTGLYNQLYNNTLQQANAVNAMSGVSGPYAAGTTDQALQNFNLAWGQQQLANQQQALQGYGQLLGTTNSALTGAGNLGTQGLGTLVTGYGQPYATSTGQANTGLSALTNLGNFAGTVYNPANSAYSALANYLRLGQGASELGQTGQQQAFNQNQVGLQQLGAGLSGIGNAFSGLFAPQPQLPSYSSNPYGLTSGYSGSIYDTSSYPTTDFGTFGY